MKVQIFERFRNIYSFQELCFKVKDLFTNFMWSRFTRQGRWARTLMDKRIASYKNTRPTELPQVLHIELTNRCNLDCQMCGHSNLERKPQDLGFDEFRHLIDQLPSSRIDSIGLYHYGESLLYPRLVDAIKYISSKHPYICTRLRTNGQLLDEKMSLELLNSGLKSLEISINGLCEAEYETIMKGASFSRLQDNLKTYLRLKGSFGKRQRNIIVTILSDHAKPYINRFSKVWFRYMPVVVTNLHSYFKAKRVDNPEDMNSICTVPCPDVFYHAVILSSGELTFCCPDVEGTLSIGNVKDDEISYIWNSERADEIRQIHRERMFHKLPICYKCTGGTLRNRVVRR